MIPRALFGLALVVASAAQAQDAAAPTGVGAPYVGLPQALTYYQDFVGYEGLSDNRHGTPVQPAQNERGVEMLARLFNNVCLSVERGALLEDVIPPGYSIYPALPYSIADNPDPDSSALAVALSPTGSIDTDETQGHPYVYLSPNPTGTSCSLYWFFDGAASTPRHLNMALMLHSFPAEIFGLLPTTSTYLDPEGFFGNVLSYDRYCGGSWCRFTTSYVLSEGEIVMATTLNITDIPRRGQ